MLLPDSPPWRLHSLPSSCAIVSMLPWKIAWKLVSVVFGRCLWIFEELGQVDEGIDVNDEIMDVEHAACRLGEMN